MPRGNRGGFRRDPSSGGLIYQATRYPVDQKGGGVSGGSGGPFQPKDPDLTSIAALTGTGIACRIANDTWALRSLVDAGSGRILITNPGGVGGNPTLDVDESALDIAALGGVLSHSALANLTADDHPQYLLLAGRPVASLNIYCSTTSGATVVFHTSTTDDGIFTFGAGGLSVTEATVPPKVTANYRTVISEKLVPTLGVWGGENSGDNLTLVSNLFQDGQVIIDGANLTINANPYVWPATFSETPGAVLTTDGFHNLSWATVTGTGTVTSVAGGAGITNSPEPIVGAGTVDLDINSLATETSLASGDLFPFVDVSVGTAPADQRKVTLGNIAAGLNALLSHSALTNLSADDHSQYLLLAGRASTANNAQISTTSNGTGTIVGATGTGGKLILRGSTASAGGIVEVDSVGLNLVNPGGASSAQFVFYNAAATHGVTLTVPTSFTTDPIYTLPSIVPTTDGQPLISTIAGALSFVSDTPSDGEVLTWHTGGSVTWDTVSGSGVTPAALTRVNDTNVTVTLGGTPATALLQATSLTLGWLGQLGLVRGGTNADLSATGGTSQVLKQSSVGAAITVGQLAFTDLSGTLAHSALSGLTSGDDHTQYLLLAGRTGTANDTILSTTVNGTIYGSSTANKELHLYATNQTNSGPVVAHGSALLLKPTNTSTFPELGVYDNNSVFAVTFKCSSSIAATQQYSLPVNVPASSRMMLASTTGGIMSWAFPIHSDLTGLTSGDDHTQYVKIAGRTTTTNDFTISTSGAGGGSITGSTLASASLNLDSGTAISPGGTSIGKAITQITGSIGFAHLAFPYNGVTIGSGGGIVNESTIVFGADNDLSAANTTNLTNGSEFLTYGLNDLRIFTKPNGSGGFTGGAPSTGQSDMDEYALVHANVQWIASNGSTMNVRKIQTFLDNNSLGETGTGDFNYLEEYKTFEAKPNFGATLGQAVTAWGLYVAPTAVASCNVNYVGALIAQDTDFATFVVLQSDATNYAASNRGLKFTGNVPSVHVGTVRIGSTAVATQPLEVLGNLLLDNSGTAAQLRFREPSASGSNFTAFQAQAQAADITYTLPAAVAASNGLVLQSTTAGALSWGALAFTDITGTLAHSSLSGLTSGDDHTQYTLLAGRTGSTNDTTLSTSATGTLYGSSASGQALGLQSTSHATRGLINLVDETRLITSNPTINPTNYPTNEFFALRWNASATLTNAGIFGVSIAPITFTGSITQTDSLGAFNSHKFICIGNPINARFTYTIQAGANLPSAAAVCYRLDMVADNGVAITTGQNSVFIDEGGYARNGTGTIAGVTHRSFWGGPFAIGAGCTVAKRYVVDVNDPSGSGAVTTQAVVHIPAMTFATTNLSVQSEGSGVQMRHAGPAVFGANAAPTNASVGLEVQSTTLAFLMSSMTRTQRNTLAGVAVANGMQLYDSTVNSTTIRHNGNWVEVPGWDISISKGADQTVTNSVTLTDDTDLQFTVASGEVWYFELALSMTGNNTTGDGKFQLLASAAAFASTWRSGVYFDGSGAIVTTLFTAAAFTSTTELVTSGGLTTCNGDGTNFPIFFKGMFRASGAATVKVQFANAAASSGRTTTIKAGSILRAKRMAP